MPWSRQTRGLSQSKLGKPNIKKNAPLPKDGDNGDFSIRNVSAGVFIFFKKTLCILVTLKQNQAE